MNEREKALAAIRAKVKKPPAFGLGDAVHSVTKALGIKHCDECERRRQRMNRWLRIEGKDVEEEEAKEESSGA